MKRAALAFAFCAVSAPAAVACDVALVVALDVSRSVDKVEYVLMRDGIAAAFLDEDVLALIEGLPGGIMATVTQWGGSGQQRQAVGWHRLQSRGSVASFVAGFSQQTRGFWMADTSVSEALLHASSMFDQLPVPCRRNVIDVSGDGISNAGPDVFPVSQGIGRRGITINGLVISGASPDPVAYFEDRVIAGPYAFVEVADGYADYPRAMQRKLLRELFPALSGVVD